MFIYLLIAFVLGGLYYDSILAFIKVMNTKTLKELDEISSLGAEYFSNHKLITVILFVIKLPLLILVAIPVFMHVYKLCKEESV